MESCVGIMDILKVLIQNGNMKKKGLTEGLNPLSGIPDFFLSGRRRPDHASPKKAWIDRSMEGSIPKKLDDESRLGVEWNGRPKQNPSQSC